MAKRLAELGALQDAVTNDEAAPSRLGLAGYIRGLFLDWSANPYNPLSRLTARGRLLGYFWDSGAIGLSMNFADQNFLVKDGTVKSKSFSEIINFSRTTNATVTNSAGLITYAPHNLLTYSEQFDNAAWTKTTTAVTANAIASPTSTTTGDTLTAGGANSTTLHSYTAIAQPYTFSIYIRRRTGTGTIEITADGSTYVAKTITSDWTRFDTTITPTAGTRTPGVRIVTSGDAIDVWGAQLEIGSTATTYNSTTVKNLLGYSELFDNAAWTKSNSFVQTNLVSYSESFDNAYWSKVGTATVTANTTLSPDGYQTADTLTGATDISWLSNNLTRTSNSPLSSSTAYTFSVYIKGLTGTTTKIAFRDGTTGVTTSSAAITLTSDWQRVSVTATTGAATTSMATIIGATDGTIAIWGAQLVQGSDAGAYRRTDAAALPVYYPNHNGVVCAEKLVSDTATTLHFIREDFVGVDNGIYTASIYAKAGEWNSIQLEIITQAGNVKGIVVNLSTGAISTGRGALPTNYGATTIGNGWYRIWVSNSIETGVALERVNIFSTNNSVSGNIAGDGTSGIYIFGAQLSDSASLDPYVLNAAAAPTAAAYYGARFDYDPVTLAPKGLLIEEQRSNLVLQSEDFSSALWTKSKVSVTANTAISPNGYQTADKIIPDTILNSFKELNQDVSITSGITYTFSQYVKNDGYNFIQIIGPASVFGDFYVNFNLTTGLETAFSAGTSTVVAKGIQNIGNGWYRVYASVTAISTGASRLSLNIIPSATSARGVTWAGDGTSGVLYWGAQLEAGAFATSYIPTAASQVTRAADVATIQGSNFYSWYNQNEGSYTANANPKVLGGNVLIFSDGTGSNFIGTAAFTSTHLSVTTNGASVVNIDAGTYVTNTDSKVAAAYKLNDFAVSLDNSAVGTDLSGVTPIINKINIGASVTGGSSFLNGTIKSISYYPQRLSNDVLKGLTA